MKKALIIIGLLVCLGLIGPKIISSVVEKKYDDIASRFVDHPSVEITERSFTTHWFSGQAVTKMSLKGISTDQESYQLIVIEELSFGPFIWSENGFSFALAQSNASFDFTVSTTDQDLEDIINTFTEQLNEKLTLSSTITYRLNYLTELSLAAMTFEQDSNRIDIGAINSEFTLEDERYITGYFNWSGLEFLGPKANVQVSAVTSTFDQEIISGDIYTGNALSVGSFSMLMENISAQDHEGNKLLSVDNVNISAQSQLEEALMNIRIIYGAEHFVGAGQTLEKLNLDISFNKLDPKVLIALNDWATKMQQNPVDTAAYMQQLNAAASKLLAQNPEININDLSVITAEGEIKSDLQLKINAALYDQANPMSIISALQVDAKGLAPWSFFQKLGLAAMINIYIEQGFIVKKADELTFKAGLDKGQLTVNGKIITL